MPVKNGASQRVIEYVAKHPGKRSRDIAKAVGVPVSSGLLSYMRQRRMVFTAGPHHQYRYFATFELAMENEAKVLREIELHRIRVEQRQKLHGRANGIKRRARAQDTRKRFVRGRTAALCQLYLPRDVRILPDVKVTIAPPPEQRFQPEPGFERVITRDWEARRAAA